MSIKKEKIIIVGGHFTPAFAVLEEAEKNYDVVWLGVKKTRIFATTKSLEFQTLKSKKIKFYSLIAGKLSRYWNGVEFFKSLIYLIRIPIGIFQSFLILIKEKPKFIIGFGGYTSVSVSFAAFILKIPFFIHEQTLVTSLASKICFPFSKILFLSFPKEEMEIEKKYLEKAIFTGWPLRKEIIEAKNKNSQLSINNKRLIFVTGGNQGSSFINSLIEKNIEKLTEEFVVIHQTGETISENKKLLEFAEKFPEKYKYSKFLSSSEMAENLQNSELVISRGGASSIYELMFLKKKAIIIPLPSSGKNEQLKNANFLKNLGLAKVLEQKEIEKNLSLFLKTFGNFIEKDIQINEDKYPKIDFEKISERILELIKKNLEN